jgi:hypothetical protein
MNMGISRAVRQVWRSAEFQLCAIMKNWATVETRNPNSEGRKRSEGRNPKNPTVCGLCSGFGFLSDFGFLVSDFEKVGLSEQH